LPCEGHAARTDNGKEARVIRLHETVEVPRPVEETFACTSDFANIEQWDPGISGSARLADEPVGPGSGRSRV